MNRLNSNPIFKDLFLSLKKINLAKILGWQDVVKKYKRSFLGPFWITISMLIMTFTISIIFGQIFKISLSDYIPFISIGIILWNFISTSIREGCSCFINYSILIKQLSLPLYLYIFRLIWKNLIILIHNIIIFPLITLFFGNSVYLISIMSIIGIMILILNLVWICTLLAIICTRYRDIEQIINNILQIIFYITPIIWMPNLLEKKSKFICLIKLNPFNNFIQIIRYPLLGYIPEMYNWIISIFFLILGFSITIYYYNIYKNKITYWI